MKDDDPARRIVVHPLAADDVCRLKASHPAAFAQLVRALRQIAASEHPLRQPYPLDICRSYPHLFDEGGYRVKARGGAGRAVVRFLDCDDFVLIDECDIDRDCVCIEIVFMDARSDITYSVLLATRVKGL